MKMAGASGERFELDIEGYQFAQRGAGVGDWLVVRGRVVDPRGAWTFVDPCLEAGDLERLAAWFESVAAGVPALPDCAFAEPSLGFSYTAGPPPVITVRFAYDGAPPWVVDGVERRDGVTVCFAQPPVDAAAAAVQLRAWQRAYPRRSAFGPEMEVA
jgi:hypothetical protein